MAAAERVKLLIDEVLVLIVPDKVAAHASVLLRDLTTAAAATLEIATAYEAAWLRRDSRAALLFFAFWLLVLLVVADLIRFVSLRLLRRTASLHATGEGALVQRLDLSPDLSIIPSVPRAAFEANVRAWRCAGPAPQRRRCGVLCAFSVRHLNRASWTVETLASLHDTFTDDTSGSTTGQLVFVTAVDPISFTLANGDAFGACVGLHTSAAIASVVRWTLPKGVLSAARREHPQITAQGLFGASVCTPTARLVWEADSGKPESPPFAWCVSGKVLHVVLERG
jgi:hypothetical protein